MPKLVEEIMNKELFTVRPSEEAAETLGYLLSLGITGAAVLGEAGRPAGMGSIRDLVGPRRGGTVEQCMTSPVDTIAEGATIDEAARALAERDRHRFVVVNDEGAAVGMVSAVDIVRGMLGLAARHPAAFPHYDRTTGLSWTDDASLDHEHVDVAPDGPGVLVLVHGGKGTRDRMVWAEGVNNVRTRVAELLSIPQSDSPLLARALGLGGLRFRAALTRDPEVRQRAAEALRSEATSLLRPPH